jgi:predicted SAM-dependent methyltransferase
MDFSHTKFSFNRSLGSYTKVQLVYSEIIRNKKMQLNRLNTLSKQYLNIGCGPNLDDKYLNLDYQWRPKLDLCWDITKGIPLSDNSIQGIYTEHCLEHITFESCQDAINAFYRILKPSGSVRIIVPDAELYINLYVESKCGKTVNFPYTTEQDIESGYTPLMAVNRVFRNHGHLFAYDHDTLSMMLMKAGFINITKEVYMEGRCKELLLDSESRKIESLYIEAEKPVL